MRLVPVDSAAARANSLYQAALNSLRPDNGWQYDELVTCNGAPRRRRSECSNQPKYLANTTLETSFQETSDPEKDKFHGCINCDRAFAGSTDLDFQLTNAYPRSRLLSAVRGGVAAVPGVAGPRQGNLPSGKSGTLCDPRIGLAGPPHRRRPDALLRS